MALGCHSALDTPSSPGWVLSILLMGRRDAESQPASNQHLATLPCTEQPPCSQRAQLYQQRSVRPQDWVLLSLPHRSYLFSPCLLVWSHALSPCLAVPLQVKLQPAVQPYLGYHGISTATQQATSELGCRPSHHQSGFSTPFSQPQVCDAEHHAAPPWLSQDRGPAVPCNAPPGTVRIAPFLPSVTAKRRQSGGTGGMGVMGSTLLVALSCPCTHTTSSST